MTGSRWKDYELSAIRKLYNKRERHIMKWKQTVYPAPPTWSWSTIAEKMTEIAEREDWPERRRYTPGNCDGVVRTNPGLFPVPIAVGVVAPLAPPGVLRERPAVREPSAMSSSGAESAYKPSRSSRVPSESMGEPSGHLKRKRSESVDESSKPLKRRLESVGEPSGQIEVTEYEDQNETEAGPSGQIELPDDDYDEGEDPEITTQGTGHTTTELISSTPSPPTASPQPSPSPIAAIPWAGPPPCHWTPEEKIALKEAHKFHKSELNKGNDVWIWKKVAKRMTRRAVGAAWNMNRVYSYQVCKRMVGYHVEFFDGPEGMFPPGRRGRRSLEDN